jgi:hypothetical protein
MNFETLASEYTGAYSIVPDSKELRAFLTYKDAFGDFYSAYKPFTRGDKPYLAIPRNVCSSLGVDRRVFEPNLEFTSLVTARNSVQQRIMAELDTLCAQRRSFILQAGTGVGKTVMGCYAIHKLAGKALIVVDQDIILNAWVDEIEKFLGLTVAKGEVGVIKGPKIKHGTHITLASLQSLCKEDKYEVGAFHGYSVVLFDEVQVLAADKFQEAVWKLPALVRIGLSATPTRRDGRDRLLSLHIGRVAIVADAVPLRPKVIRAYSEWKCPRVLVKGVPVKVKHVPGRLMPITKDLAVNTARNLQIGEFLVYCKSRARNVLVLSDLKDHLKTIKGVCLSLGISEDDVGFFWGGMAKGPLEKASLKPIVLSTYKFCAKAVNKPWWDTLVLATPKADVKQPLGRILREYEGKKSWDDKGPGVFPVVFDIIDSDSNVLYNYSKAREKIYNTIKSTIKGP